METFNEKLDRDYYSTPSVKYEAPTSHYPCSCGNKIKKGKMKYCSECGEYVEKKMNHYFDENIKIRHKRQQEIIDLKNEFIHDVLQEYGIKNNEKYINLVRYCLDERSNFRDASYMVDDILEIIT